MYFGTKATPPVSAVNKLVLEHVTPINLLVIDLLAKVAEPGCTEQDFAELLQDKHRALNFVNITAEEYKQITGAGFKKALVTDDGASAWARYEMGCMLKEDDFLAVTADPRFAQYAGV